MTTERLVDDINIRAYIASVVGAFRQLFGTRAFAGYPLGVVTSKRLAQNSTKDRVLSVWVSRTDVLGGGTSAIFSQNDLSAGSSDFAVSFAGSSSFHFVLKPGETLLLQSDGTASMNVVVGSETY